MSLLNDVIKGAYTISRVSSKTGTALNTAKNISNGDVEKVGKTLLRKLAHKGLNNLLR